jgi:alkylated DNA nucleotide flippase Atl1
VKSVITRECLAAVVAAIPPGRWVSYGDVAHACGGTERHARTLNQRFIRDGVAGAHRVLKGDGSVSAGALGAPDAVRGRLEAEGVTFIEGRADPDARIYPRDIAGAIGSS